MISLLEAPKTLYSSARLTSLTRSGSHLLVPQGLMRRGFLLSSRSRAQEIRPGSVATPPNISVVNHASTNSTVAIPHLPPELSDRILDHLHDDLLTLNSCSRVCRAWLPRSRFHYFHAIELTSYAGARFADILTTNPHIGTLVHLVGIRILDRSDGDSNSLMRALPPIALRLPNVEKLTLHGDGEYTAPPFRNFTNVRELRIVGCEIPAFDDFIGIICFLPKLEILSCSRALIGLTSIVKRPSTELPRPRIKRLEFITTRIDPTEFTQWLIDEKMYDSIEEILLRPLHVLAMHPVGNFVSKVGPSLKEFDIALIETAILNSGMFGGKSSLTYKLSERIG